MSVIGQNRLLIGQTDDILMAKLSIYVDLLWIGSPKISLTIYIKVTKNSILNADKT